MKIEDEMLNFQAYTDGCWLAAICQTEHESSEM